MTVARTALSRERPYPYDAYVSTVPVILKPGDDDNMVGRKSKTLDATAPSVYDYSSQSPYKERTEIFRSLIGGMGQSVEDHGPIRRYGYTTNCDLSIYGKWMKGPKFESHIETINASAGAVRQLIIGLHNTTPTLFAICDNGVWRRVSDGTWTASLTGSTVPALPGGQIPQKAVRFKGRFGGATDDLYLGTDDGNIWKYNGTVWSQAGAPAGPGDGAGNGECRYVTSIGDEFWVAGDYWVVKCEADPMLRASYSAVIWIGDQSSKISWIEQVDNVLYVFKRDGRIFTVSSLGEDVELFPNINRKSTPYNGRNAVTWLDRMWAPMGDSLVLLDGEGNLTPDGLENLLDNTSPVRGRFVAGTSHHTWFMYEIYFNEILNTSYLVKHGTWVADPESQAAMGASRFIETHHGSLAEWNKEATSAATVSDLHATSNDRLYVGFDDGTVEWCVLPRNSPDPTKDTACEFTGLSSYVYLPDHHANFQADNKLWQGISVFGQYLSPNEYATVEYKISQDDLAAWEMLNDPTSGTKYTYSGQRIDFTDEPPVYSKVISTRVGLVKNADLGISPVNISPVLEGIGIHESVRPSLSIEWTMNILASSFNAKRDGTTDRRRGSLIREQLLELTRQVRNIDIILPTGEVENVAILDYNESWRSRPNRRDLEWTIQMVFIQVKTLTENIVSEGLTYDELEVYTLDELEDII